LEPWDIEPNLFSLWEDKRLCPHFHLPLQSGSAAILKRMARKTTPAAFMDLVKNIRIKIPQAAITTDVIVGFPGETDDEFEESQTFIKAVAFSAGHIFHFSPRPGTPAFNFPNRVPKEKIKERSSQCRMLFEEMGKTFNQGFIGEEAEVLWESTIQNPDGTWTVEGWTPNYIRVQAIALERVWNHQQRVRLLEPFENGLRGIII
jgi:threonylcarbamoyladenosine tRNA methylthiotransferase MtaB